MNSVLATWPVAVATVGLSCEVRLRIGPLPGFRQPLNMYPVPPAAHTTLSGAPVAKAHKTRPLVKIPGPLPCNRCRDPDQIPVVSVALILCSTPHSNLHRTCTERLGRQDIPVSAEVLRGPQRHQLPAARGESDGGAGGLGQLLLQSSTLGRGFIVLSLGFIP